MTELLSGQPWWFWPTQIFLVSTVLLAVLFCCAPNREDLD